MATVRNSLTKCTATGTAAVKHGKTRLAGICKFRINLQTWKNLFREKTLGREDMR